MSDAASVAVSDMVRATERWFDAHGLPYFVEDNLDRVHQALGRGRLTGLVGIASACGIAAGVGAGLWTGAASTGVDVGIVVLAAALLGYAVTQLRGWSILTWACRRAGRSLRLLFPLVTRALPLLLLFITFFFINAEVWQVTSTMDGALLWLVVILFTGLGVLFLVVRLPEEVERVSREVGGPRLADQCRGTPVASYVDRLGDSPIEAPPLHGLQRANLLLVLLVVQAVQVLVLSLTVFVFFVAFGRLAISPSVIQSWTGHPPQPLGSSLVGSVELFQVSVFLAAFAGLYFTVYAVTDQIYRDQFFTHVSHELERAVGVRTVYLEVRRLSTGGPG
ncbi:MAG: hypothetical protein ACRDOY_08705 [Nocardioidaceae bacterium]